MCSLLFEISTQELRILDLNCAFYAYVYVHVQLLRSIGPCLGQNIKNLSFKFFSLIRPWGYMDTHKDIQLSFKMYRTTSTVVEDA